MKDTRIILIGLWIALMLTYLLGDVMRIFAGDFEPGKIQGAEGKPWMWMMAALFMLIPILMIVLNLLLPHPAIRWVNIALAVFVALFNVFGLPYKGAYDNFLIGVGFVLNGITLYFALRWATA